MFFRNAKPKVESFEERIAGLKELGFAAKTQSPGRCLVTRAGCGAIAEDLGDGKMGIAVGKAGVLVGGEIALLIHGGYQMFLRTPSGKEVPALATHLKTLHAFDALQIDDGPNMQTPDRCVRIDGRRCAVTRNDVQKFFDVVAQPFGSDGGVLDERNRLRVPLLGH